MATAWKVAAATAVIGWLVAPVVAYFLPKVMSYLVVDPSEKLRDLKTRILPELEKTLHKVDEARMMSEADRARERASDLSALSDMAAWLRHAREDAEDILDDALEIELYSCWEQLYGAVATCKSSCVRLLQWAGTVNYGDYCSRLYGAVQSTMWIALQWPGKILHRAGVSIRASITRCRSARLLLWAWNRFEEPVTGGVASHTYAVDIAYSDSEAVPDAARSNLASHEEAVSESAEAVSEATPLELASVPVAVSEAMISDSASYKEAVPEATPSGSASASHEQALVPVATPPCSSSDVFKNRCSEKAGFNRDWSYAGAGITSNQVNASALDLLVTAISRWRLKKRIEKLESTISEVNKSTLLGEASKSAPDDIANKNRSRIRTASNNKVFGREVLRDCIMAKLRETPHGDAGPCYSVIGICGVAGSGKTTFARYTRDYIEKECKDEKLFDTTMCIHLSQTFSVDDVFHEMLKDITKDRHSHISDREDLENKLKESLSDKRFFLILDDIWVDNKSDKQLQELLSPLNVGKTGSKVLVTARTEYAARALGADKPIALPDMDEDQYFSMFMYHALDGTSVADEELTLVGREISKKLHRSPIAAAIVAGRLGTNPDILFWKNTAKLDMLSDTMSALWWSYQQLNPDIRRCFEYYNIFPRRLKLRSGELVQLWISQGFVRTSCATEDMEDVAEGYIQVLVSRSFLQREKDDKGKYYFGIHDLLHDLIDKIAGSDFFRIGNESSQREGLKGDVPQDVRHVFIPEYDRELITKKVLTLVNLRTLIIDVVKVDRPVDEKVIDRICKKLPKLRVLVIASSIDESGMVKVSIPKSQSQLKYLRYFAFRLRLFSIITLPSTLNKLQHIQILDFGDGTILGFSGAELVSLRHIFCSPFVKLPYLGRLTSLRTLPVFEVSNEQGCELEQLRDLNMLRGKLDIRGLENVKSKGQALQANLAAKQLTELSLWWSSGQRRSSPEVQSDVLEGLCPHVELRKLALWNFVGCRYPDWMVGKDSDGPKYLQELRELRLWECSQPAFGLAKAFPHLRVLQFIRCSWDALPGNMDRLTSLKELGIYSCRNIRSLPSLPQSLEKFSLFSCNDEFMVSCQTAGHPNWEKLEPIEGKSFFPSIK